MATTATRLTKDASDTWTEPVIIGGHGYHFSPSSVRRNGTQLWTVSIGLAEYVAGLEIQGSSVELGCGQGLVGMITGATLIDSDPVTIANTRETLRLNGKQCRIIEASWENINEPFDNVFGSEILYRMYKPETVAEFLDRCWTGKGACLLVVSRPSDVPLFEQRARELGFTYVREAVSYRGFEYTLIRVNGVKHA